MTRIALRMSQPNTLNASHISCCVIQTGVVGIVTAPFSLIVIIPLSIMYVFDVFLILVPFGHTEFGPDASGQFLHVLVTF